MSEDSNNGWGSIYPKSHWGVTQQSQKEAEKLEVPVPKTTWTAKIKNLLNLK